MAIASEFYANRRVETTNFNGRTASVTFGILGAPPGNRIPTSQQMKIIERFTRTSADTISDEITTTDPVGYDETVDCSISLEADARLRVVGIRVPRRQSHDP